MNRISHDDLRWLLKLLEAEGLTELQVRGGESEVVISAAPAIAAAPHSREAALDQSPYGAELDEHHIPVLAPVAGLFYRAGSPDAAPFVELGDEVIHGDTVALVEAMKLFNEVPAPATGAVISILAENGQQVAVDEVLMVIET